MHVGGHDASLGKAFRTSVGRMAEGRFEPGQGSFGEAVPGSSCRNLREVIAPSPVSSLLPPRSLAPSREILPAEEIPGRVLHQGGVVEEMSAKGAEPKEVVILKVTMKELPETVGIAASGRIKNDLL